MVTYNKPLFLESVWCHAHAHKQQEQARSCSLACDSSLRQSSWQSRPPPLFTCSCFSHPPLHMDEGNSKKQKRMTEPTARDFLLGGKDIQNKVGRAIGSAGTEEHHFREFFGMGPSVASKLWIMMADHAVIPPEGEIKNLLWTLHFLKAYPRQSAVCSTVGGQLVRLTPNVSEVHVAIYLFHCRSWDCGDKLTIILFSMISF